MIRFSIALLFFAPAAFAGEWVRLSQEKFEAHSEKEIQALMDRFPEAFHGRASELEQLQVGVTRFEWKGKTICRKGDPRLRQDQFETSSTSKPGPHGEQGGGGSITGLPTGEPCLEDLPPDGRWVLQNERAAEYRSKREIASWLKANKYRFPHSVPEDFVRVTENLQTWRWEGRTKCAPGDSRLLREHDAGEVEMKGSLSGMSGIPFADDEVHDPCRD